jgi:hypothetical protein
VLTLFVISLLTSCQDVLEAEVEEIGQQVVTKSLAPENELMNNPYEVEFMQSVLEEIRILSTLYNDDNSFTGMSLEDFSIIPNYQYIKFTPQDEEQEAILRDSELPIVDFPLDYIDSDHYYISTKSDFPEDEEVPVYYTGLPLSTQLPPVPYEVIEMMYVPDEDPYFSDVNEEESPSMIGRVSSKFDLINHLYSFAFTNSGNIDLLPPDVEKPDGDEGFQKFLGISFRSKWTPKGNAKIWDDLIGETTTTVRVFLRYEYYDCGGDTYISDTVEYEGYNEDDQAYGAGTSDINKNLIDIEPIEDTRTCRRAIYETRITGSTQGGFVPLVGAQVLIRDGYTLGNAITATNGNFRFRDKRPAVRYHMQWERKHYSIRDNGWQAMLRGPRMRKRDWNLRINGGEDQYHADIHRGAHMYYYENLPNLSRPPTNSTWSRQMKLAAVEYNGSSSHVPIRFLYNGSQIKLKVYGDPQDEVIGVTIHELAHAMHWDLDRSSYYNLVQDGYVNFFLPQETRDRNKRLLESYACHIEITYMNEFYRRLGVSSNYEYQDNFQLQTIVEDNIYTSGIFDLTDDDNQSLIDFARPNDPVDGYSLLQLEDALIGATHWGSYRQNILDLNVGNPVDVNILFNNW